MQERMLTYIIIYNHIYIYLIYARKYVNIYARKYVRIDARYKARKNVRAHARKMSYIYSRSNIYFQMVCQKLCQNNVSGRESLEECFFFVSGYLRSKVYHFL